MIQLHTGPEASLDIGARNGIRIWRQFIHSPSAIVGIVFVLVTILAAVFGPMLVPNITTVINLNHTLMPPIFVHGSSLLHPLGTDYLGRDVLSLVLAGAQISVDIALLSVVCSLILGTVIGICSGYFGGTIDELLMRLTDVQMALPFILIALTFINVTGPGAWKVVVVLTLSGWTNYARIVRSQTLQRSSPKCDVNCLWHQGQSAATA